MTDDATPANLSVTSFPWLATVRARALSQIAAGTLGHATLIAGPSGVGKRALAQELIAALLCNSRTAEDAACGTCAACQQRIGGTHPDLVWATPEPEKRDVSVDTIREFSRKMMLTPEGAGGRVGVVDPSDRMNTNAANALLKTLEEPPSGAHLLLIADRPSTLPATIRSRCQLLRVGVTDSEQAIAWLRSRFPDVAREHLARFATQPLLADDAGAETEERAYLDAWGDWRRSLVALWEGAAAPVNVAAGVPDAQVQAWMRWLYREQVAILRGDADAAWPSDSIEQDSFRQLCDSTASMLRLYRSQASPRLCVEALCIELARAGQRARKRAA